MNLSSLIDDLFRTNRHNNVPSILQFKQIDIDGTARRLNLEKLGCENGSRGLPLSDAKTLDATEQSIVGEMEAQGQRDYGDFLEHQKTYHDRIGTLGIEGLVLEIGATARSAVADFNNRIHNGLDHLYLLKTDVTEAEKDLEQFRAQHRLSTRPAWNLGSKMPKVGALVFLWALETLVNGPIFVAGSEGGLIEAFGIALALSALNICIGFASGLALTRWLIHRRWMLKFCGMLGLVTYVCLGGATCLLIAHVRAAISTGGLEFFDATRFAFNSFKTDPFGLNDAFSWVLFGLGVLCSLFAHADAWAWTDPYPGYGRRAALRRRAAEDYAEEKEDLLEELEELKATAEKSIEGKFRDIAARRSEYDYILAKSQAMILALEQHLVHLETSANRLLGIYRNANLKCRKADVPPPAHFETNWIYAKPDLQGQTIPDSLRQQVDSAVKSAAAEIPEHHKAIIAAYDQAMIEYRRIEQLTGARA